MSKAKPIKSIRDVRPQRVNANRHTQRGLGLLEDSIQQLGWIGAITVAADGETFDGSARVEVGASAGFEDAIVVESDGSKPIIHRRIDIPTADDPKARELGIRANRVAQVDLDWDADILKGLAEEGVKLDDLFTADEFMELVHDVPAFEPASIDEQGRLDEKKKCTCPECGHEFTP